jgi:uncharacterized protein (DUF2147 family)
MSTSFIKLITLGVGLSLAGLSQAAELEGTWRSIDDRTGFSRGIVEIKQEADGSYSGTVIKSTPRPGYTPKETCQNCPPPYTDQPMIGLKVLTGLKADPNKPGHYTGGKILDPLSGKIYSSKAKLSPDNRRLSMRGYVGVSMLGRSQTWMREQ